MSSKVKRTYGSRVRAPLPSSPPSSSPPQPPPESIKPKRKRPFEESFTNSNLPPLPKRPKSLITKSKSLSTTPKPKLTQTSNPKSKSKSKSLTQLHFTPDNSSSILRTCPLCDLSYTKGAPDDESLHKSHCARVLRGMGWGREEEREAREGKGVGFVEVVGRGGIRLKDGRMGRIICFRADVGGKIGSKLTTLLETINLALSSPPLTPAVLRASKAYLLLIPLTTNGTGTGTSSSSHREKIVGCVIAQRISTAMAIATSTPSPSPLTLIPVDPTTSLFCHPTLLPTPLGIPRLFVPSTHRRQSIATHLLDAAARTFVHGCPLDPRRGEVAFSQPTGAGGGIMRAWGGGGVRIYEE